MDYALPRAAVQDAVRAVQKMIKNRELRISFPVEVQSAVVDQIWVSTARDRLSGYVAARRYHRDRDTEPDFDAVEETMLSHGGRPHWGKLHTPASCTPLQAAHPCKLHTPASCTPLSADGLRSLYPRFDDFLAVRDGWLPTNPYLDRVGP